MAASMIAMRNPAYVDGDACAIADRWQLDIRFCIISAYTPAPHPDPLPGHGEAMLRMDRGEGDAALSRPAH